MTDIKEKNHILVINFSRLENVLELIRELESDKATLNQSICLIDDTLAELPRTLQDHNVLFVHGNPTREDTLQQANIAEASHAIVLSKDPSNSHSDDRNLAITLVMESLNPNIFSIAQVIEPEKIHQIELAGCDSVVCVAELTANLVIQELQDPGVKGIIHELTSNKYGPQFYLVAMTGIKEKRFRDLVLWGLDNRYTVAGLMRENRPLLNCGASETLMGKDKAIVMGSERLSEINLTAAS